MPWAIHTIVQHDPRGQRHESYSCSESRSCGGVRPGPCKYFASDHFGRPRLSSCVLCLSVLVFSPASMLAPYWQPCPVSPMLHRVDPLALGRSVVELGSAAGLRPFFDRLHRGEAVSIGLLGASVGQSGGCLSQPYKRCMLYRGVQSSLDGYEPTRAGYLLQFFDAINRSWPHPQHAVFNAATDGIQQADMCR